MTEIGIEQARATLGDIANQAADTGTITYLTRRGRRVAAVVPVDEIAAVQHPDWSQGNLRYGFREIAA